MASPQVGVLRLGRALAFGLTAFGLSVLAHVFAGGPPPSATASGLLGLGTLWVSVFLTGRRLGVIASVASLGALQVALHGGLSLSSPSTTCVNVLHSHVTQLTAGPMTMCAGPTSAHHHGHGIPSLLMTVAHAVAAVLLGVLLARADRAVWFLAGLVWPSLPTPVTAVVAPSMARSAPGAAPVLRSRWVGLAAVCRRGPPWVAAPVAV